MKIFRTLGACAVALGLPGVAAAATITFSPTAIPIEPTSVPAGQTQADVDLAPPTGYTVFGAARFGATTAQSVTLSAAAGGTTINFTAGGVNGTGGTVAYTTVNNTNGTGAFSSAGQTTGNSNFDTILNNYAYDGNPQAITILGLTSGTTYQVSLFGVDNRACCGGRTIKFYDPVTTTNASPTIAENSNQYVIGTFTATGSTQQINLNGVSNPGSNNINALVVYQQTPEPASLGLLALGSLGLLARRRRTA